jgi:hypothetical protein
VAWPGEERSELAFCCVRRRRVVTRTCPSCVCVLVTFTRKNVRSVRSPVSYGGTYS